MENCCRVTVVAPDTQSVKVAESDTVTGPSGSVSDEWRIVRVDWCVTRDHGMGSCNCLLPLLLLLCHLVLTWQEAFITELQTAPNPAAFFCYGDCPQVSGACRCCNPGIVSPAFIFMASIKSDDWVSTWTYTKKILFPLTLAASACWFRCVKC